MDLSNDLNAHIINFSLEQPEASELQMNLRMRFEALSKSPLNQVARAPYGGWSSKVWPEKLIKPDMGMGRYCQSRDSKFRGIPVPFGNFSRIHLNKKVFAFDDSFFEKFVESLSDHMLIIVVISAVKKSISRFYSRNDRFILIQKTNLSFLIGVLLKRADYFEQIKLFLVLDNARPTRLSAMTL